MNPSTSSHLWKRAHQIALFQAELRFKQSRGSCAMSVRTVSSRQAPNVGRASAWGGRRRPHETTAWLRFRPRRSGVLPWASGRAGWRDPCRRPPAAAAPGFPGRRPAQVGAAIKKKPDGGRLPLENRVLQRRRVQLYSEDPAGSRRHRNRGGDDRSIDPDREAQINAVHESPPSWPYGRRREVGEGRRRRCGRRPGSRGFGTLSAGARREQRDAGPEQKHETALDDLREISSTKTL